MQLTSCNNGSLSRIVAQAAAKSDLQRIVEASSKDNLYEDIFPAIYMVAKASHGVLGESDVKETLSKLADKGIRIESPEFQAQVVKTAFDLGGMAAGVGSMFGNALQDYRTGRDEYKVNQAKQQAQQAIQNLMTVDKDPQSQKMYQSLLTQLQAKPIPPAEAAKEMAAKSAPTTAPTAPTTPTAPTAPTTAPTAPTTAPTAPTTPTTAPTTPTTPTTPTAPEVAIQNFQKTLSTSGLPPETIKAIEGLLARKPRQPKVPKATGPGLPTAGTAPTAPNINSAFAPQAKP